MNKIILFIIAIILCPTITIGSTYYVDKDSVGGACNDSNNGTAITTPWCTIDKANKTLIGGDTVYIRAGTYQCENNNVGDGGAAEYQCIKPVNSGTEGSYIVYSVYNDETVNFVGKLTSGQYNYSTGINLDGRSYVKITGGSSGYNMTFSGLARNVIIGKATAGHYNEINHCDFGAPWQFTATSDGAVDGTTIISSDLTKFPSDSTSIVGLDIIIKGATGGVSKTTGWNTDTDTITVSPAFSRRIVVGDIFFISNHVKYAGILISNNSQYNYIHDNKIHDWQAYTAGSDGPVCVEIGADTGAYPTTSYNVIENNYMYHCGHHVIGMHGTHNVIRNNVSHNEPYYNVGGTLYGYRNFHTVGNSARAGGHVIEGNKWGQTGLSMIAAASGQKGGSSGTFASSYNIFRYNSLSNSLAGGVYLKAYTGDTNKWGECIGNHLYNNTFYLGGYTTEHDVSGSPDYRMPWDFEASTVQVGTPTEEYHDSGEGNTIITGNVIKNNLYHKTWGQTTADPADAAITRPYSGELAGAVNEDPTDWAAALANQIITNNYKDATASTENIFSDYDITDAMATTFTAKPHLSLVPGAAPIDHGSYLTQASSADSSSNTLYVDDARYFQDGKFGNGITWPTNITTMLADEICVGTVSNCSQIDSINYDENKITLSSALTWADNAPVWLFKKSDGAQVLYGSAPDMGAHERTVQKFTGNIMIGGAGVFN